MHIHSALYISDVPGKGRGVFTNSSLQKNEEIETSPVVVMSEDEYQLLDKTQLHNYIFQWNPEKANECCLALGYVSVYNHSYKSNCEYFMDYENNTITISAVRNIEAGEELTINYNGDWNDDKEIWFEAAD